MLALAVVLLEACSCEERGGEPAVEVPLSWRGARESPGHVAHLAEDIGCEDCHGEGEIQPPGPELCAECHEELETTLHASVAEGCTSCHAFAEEHFEANDCQSCHRRAQGSRPAIAVHVADCTDCHRPHARPSLVSRDCLGCHAEQRTQHGARPAGPEGCTDCHAMHAEHDASARCVQCHARRAPIVRAGALFRGHGECVDCHVPHDFSRGRERACTRCHEGMAPLAPQASGHQRCESCHRPHDVRAAGEAGCVACHSGVQSTHPPTEHQRCLGCHAAHPPRSQRGDARSCVSCHREASSETAFHAGGTRCRDCHPTHDEARVRSGATCADCHRALARRAARVHPNCGECHTGSAHRAVAPEPQCERCHAREHDAAIPAHRACGECHRTHDGSLRRACTDCHAALPPGASARGHLRG